MTYVVSSYFSSFALYGCWKEVKTLAVVWMVPDGQQSGVVDSDMDLPLKRKVRFPGWTEIVEADASTACGRVECLSFKNEHGLYWPSTSETAGARYQQWLGWYLGAKV